MAATTSADRPAALAGRSRMSPRRRAELSRRAQYAVLLVLVVLAAVTVVGLRWTATGSAADGGPAVALGLPGYTYGHGAILALMFTFYPLLADRKQLFEDAPGVFAAVAMGLGLSIWSLLDTLVEPVAGRISDRIGRQPVAIPGLVLAIVGAYLLSRATSTFPAYAAIAIMSIGWGSARAVADTVSQDVIPPVLRGMSAAILYTSFDLAIGIDAQILSTLIDGADFSRLFTTVLLMVGIFGTLGLLLSTRVPVYERPAVPIEEPEPAEPAKVPALHD